MMIDRFIISLIFAGIVKTAFRRRHFAVYKIETFSRGRLLQASVIFQINYRFCARRRRITRLVALRQRYKAGPVPSQSRCETLAKSREPFGLIERYYIAVCRAWR